MDANYSVHESAYVDDGAQIGSGTKVWHFCHITSTARIGRDCTLGQNVYVGNHVTLGDRVKVQNNVSVYEGVELEDDVFCGPSMVFTNVRKPRSAYPKAKGDYDKTRVGRGTTIGANATIVCGVTIGCGAFIAAGAVVTRTVPDHALVAGVPARLVGWVCDCSERLDFTGENATCAHCGKRYSKSGPDAIAPLP